MSNRTKTEVFKLATFIIIAVLWVSGHPEAATGFLAGAIFALYAVVSIQQKQRNDRRQDRGQS